VENLITPGKPAVAPSKLAARGTGGEALDWRPVSTRLPAVGASAFLAVLLASASASAQVSEPAPRPDEQFDFMNFITQHGLHDIKDESWNAYGQFTYITSWHLPFSAAYTNLNNPPGVGNSLLPTSERSWTGTSTLFFGLRLWHGAEAYFVPEVVAEQAFSGLHGLGGAIQNFELQKQGATSPIVYQSRAYIQQTIGLGGAQVAQDSNPLQLGSVVDGRRLVVRAGNFSVIDFFDKNTFSGDLRESFFNMAFLTYAAYDFVADARGYSLGAMAELYYDDWSARIGRFAPPQDPNGLPLTLEIDKFYGDQVEIEHDHQLFGRAGAIRVLGFHNRENMGKFRDAIAAFRADPAMNNASNCGSRFNYYLPGTGPDTAPDLCFVRSPHDKVGIGINVEQHITDDIGVFLRGMYSDGQTEVYSFTSTDRSISVGATAKGPAWQRPFDVAGAGFGVGWISQAHADYLRMGGIDGFIGDGTIREAPESVFDVFYSVSVANAVWLSADYQRVWNPAFNADRGPVDIFGARVHAEY
jgi:high affinity Mn2+ porin